MIVYAQSRKTPLAVQCGLRELNCWQIRRRSQARQRSVGATSNRSRCSSNRFWPTSAARGRWVRWRRARALPSVAANPAARPRPPSRGVLVLTNWKPSYHEDPKGLSVAANVCQERVKRAAISAAIGGVGRGGGATTICSLSSSIKPILGRQRLQRLRNRLRGDAASRSDFSLVVAGSSQHDHEFLDVADFVSNELSCQAPQLRLVTWVERGGPEQGQIKSVHDNIP